MGRVVAEEAELGHDHAEGGGQDELEPRVAEHHEADPEANERHDESRSGPVLA